ncbi:MAG: DUF6106 family protein [Lachnospiraceae bacterium]|nr:DUF6106 family protein [Lachnospiraceae bacterium]
MNDSYVELLVKRKPSVGFLIGRNLLGGLGAIAVFLGIFSGGLFIFFILFALLLFGGAFLMHQKVAIEYEYLYLDKTLTIDRISNQTRRKKIAEYDLQNLELLAPSGSDKVKEYTAKKDVKILDFSSRGFSEETKEYAMIISKGNQLILAKIECNDVLYDHFRMIAPRKVSRD